MPRLLDGDEFFDKLAEARREDAEREEDKKRKQALQAQRTAMTS